MQVLEQHHSLQVTALLILVRQHQTIFSSKISCHVYFWFGYLFLNTLSESDSVIRL